MAANGLKVHIAVLMQLQRAPHDPSQGIRVLSNEKKYKFRYFLTTNTHLALALRCTSTTSHMLERASARRSFVVKKYIDFFFFRK